jgi:nucleotide-binding universal stress UspA family protein
MLAVGTSLCTLGAPGAKGDQRMNVLLAVDGSRSARHALRWIQSQPVRTSWKLHVVTVVAPWSTGFPPPEKPWLPLSSAEHLLEECRLTRQSALQEAVQTLRGHGFAVTAHLRQGEPATAIRNLARDIAAELIITGRSAHPRWLRWVTGSVSSELLDHWPGPVILVPAHKHLSPRREIY